MNDKQPEKTILMLERLSRLAALYAFVASFGTAVAAQEQVFTDTDWNLPLKVSCGLPTEGAMKQVRVGGDQKLRVTLNQGDIGQCGTDNKRRHSAPFWERAEVAQVARMPLGRNHRISAEVTIESGFTGAREAFLQIHGWTPNCQKASPPVMLKFHKGLLKIETLRRVTRFRAGNHRDALRKRVAVAGLYGKPLRFVLDFDTTTSPGKLSVSMNGAELVKNARVEFAACAQPYLKIGAYRPGGAKSGTSVVVFDDLRVE